MLKKRKMLYYSNAVVWRENYQEFIYAVILAEVMQVWKKIALGLLGSVMHYDIRCMHVLKIVIRQYFAYLSYFYYLCVL